MICNFETDDVLYALDESSNAAASIMPLGLLAVANSLLNPAGHRNHPRYYDGGAMTLVEANEQADLRMLRVVLEELERDRQVVSFRGREAAALFTGLRADRTYYIRGDALGRAREASGLPADEETSSAAVLAAMFSMVRGMSDTDLEGMCARMMLTAGGGGILSAKRIRNVIKNYQEKTCSVYTAS